MLRSLEAEHPAGGKTNIYDKPPLVYYTHCSAVFSLYIYSVIVYLPIRQKNVKLIIAPKLCIRPKVAGWHVSNDTLASLDCDSLLTSCLHTFFRRRLLG